MRQRPPKRVRERQRRQRAAVVVVARADGTRVFVHGVSVRDVERIVRDAIASGTPARLPDGRVIDQPAAEVYVPGAPRDPDVVARGLDVLAEVVRAAGDPEPSRWPLDEELRRREARLAEIAVEDGAFSPNHPPEETR